MPEIFKDFAALEAKFNSIGRAMQKTVLIKAARKGAKVIRDEAERRAPVLKEPRKDRVAGSLAKHEILSIAGTGSNSAEVIVKIGPDKHHFYGLFQEKGTAHQTGKPFLGPSLTAKQSEAIATTRDIMLEELERII